MNINTSTCLSPIANNLFTVYIVIVCVIGPGKSAQSLGIILQLHTPFHTDKAASLRWPGLLSQMVDFWTSITPSHVRVLIDLYFI